MDVDPLRDAVPVTAVGRGNDVGRAELRADANGDRLLAGVEVHEAAHLAGGDELTELLLEAADHSHLSVGVEQLLAVQVHGFQPRLNAG